MVHIATILRHNLLGKLLNHVLVFLINVMLVRLLGPELSGKYFNELYVLNFLLLIASLGLDFIAVNLVSEDPGYTRPVRQLLLRSALIIAGIFALFFAIAHALLPGSNFSVIQPLTAAYLFFTGNVLLCFFQAMLAAQKRFNLQNFILLATNLVFLVILFVMHRKGVAASNFIYMGYGALICLQGIAMLTASYITKAPVARTFPVRLFFRRGILIVLSSMAYFLFLRIDNFFVQHYCSPVELSNYLQCGKTGQYFIYFSAAISATLLPFIARENIGSSYRDWLSMLKPYLACITAIAILIALTGRWIFPLLFGNEFRDMHVIMNILLPGYVCLGLLTLMNSVYIGKGNLRRILIGDVGGFLLVLAGDALVVPVYGITGAAIVSSVSYILLFFFLAAGFRKQFDKPSAGSIFSKDPSLS